MEKYFIVRFVNSSEDLFRFFEWILSELKLILSTKNELFLLRFSSVNVTKSQVSCGFDHIYWRNTYGKLHFLGSGLKLVKQATEPCNPAPVQSQQQRNYSNGCSFSSNDFIVYIEPVFAYRKEYVKFFRGSLLKTLKPRVNGFVRQS